MFYLISWCMQVFFQSNICIEHRRKHVNLFEKGYTIKETVMQKRSKNHEMGSEIGHKSSRGPSGGALAPLGVPKGSQTEFWEWKASSLDPLWTPWWVQFFVFFFNAKLVWIFVWYSFDWIFGNTATPSHYTWFVLCPPRWLLCPSTWKSNTISKLCHTNHIRHKHLPNL